MKPKLTLALLLLLVLPCVAHNVVVENDNYKISHEWTHNGLQWTCTLNVPVGLYQYYQARAHLSDDMVQFVLSDHDRLCVQNLVKSFREGGLKANYTDADNMGNVISFVQSLRYVSDLDSKGEQEYVRFPMETLVDGIGDCEDLAILAATILHEMGYGVLLVTLPDHMALAVACDESYDGVYYEYGGRRYYYLEVTNTGWAIGQIPKEYRSSGAKLTPLLYRPRLRLNHCSYRHERYYSTDREVPYTLQCELENAGPGTTNGLSIHVRFTTYSGVSVVDRVFPLDELSEGVSGTCTLTVSVPRPLYGTLEVRAEGNNFNTESLKFENINLE
ncbi:MAG: hypothetical protein II887_00690 [Bacteroidales bacterium]|nr:hypothetical protein [Bacteroidales bacterium]